MGFFTLPHRTLVPLASIDIHRFRKHLCSFLSSYAWMWILIVLLLAMLGADCYTAVCLLVFLEWLSEIQPSIPLSTARWIFVVCIILSFVLLVYHWVQAIAVIRTGRVADIYMTPIARNLYLIRNYSYFCFFASVETDLFFDWCVEYCWGELYTALLVTVCEGPRQVINAVTVYLAIRKQNANPITAIKQIARLDNISQATVLSFMTASFLIWCFFMVMFVFAMVMWIPIEVKVRRRGATGLRSYYVEMLNKNIRSMARMLLKDGFRSDTFADSFTLSMTWNAIPPLKGGTYSDRAGSQETFQLMARRGTEQMLAGEAEALRDSKADVLRESKAEAMRERKAALTLEGQRDAKRNLGVSVEETTEWVPEATPLIKPAVAYSRERDVYAVPDVDPFHDELEYRPSHEERGAEKPGYPAASYAAASYPVAPYPAASNSVTSHTALPLGLEYHSSSDPHLPDDNLSLYDYSQMAVQEPAEPYLPVATHVPYPPATTHAPYPRYSLYAGSLRAPLPEDPPMKDPYGIGRNLLTLNAVAHTEAPAQFLHSPTTSSVYTQNYAPQALRGRVATRDFTGSGYNESMALSEETLER